MGEQYGIVSTLKKSRTPERHTKADGGDDEGSYECDGSEDRGGVGDDTEDEAKLGINTVKKVDIVLLPFEITGIGKT